MDGRGKPSTLIWGWGRGRGGHRILRPNLKMALRRAMSIGAMPEVLTWLFIVEGHGQGKSNGCGMKSMITM